MSTLDQKTREQGKKLLDDWRKDPEFWHRSCFDNFLWEKQSEILRAVRDYKYIAVKSGNTVGKTRIAAEVVLWYLSTYYPSKVITTAPGWIQVADVLWKEITQLVRTTKIPFEADILQTELRFSPEWFALGIATDNVYRLQGFHSPNLLVVIDEASGVPPEIWEAITALHPSKILAIGNPLDPSGNFFDCFSSPLWHKITIDCEECVEWQKQQKIIPGLVSQEWINERVGEWGRKSPMFQSHVLGEFPDEGEGTLISRKWVQDSRTRKNDGNDGKIQDLEEDGVRVIACDVATKHGTNETVIANRYDHTLKSIKGYLHLPTTETGDRLGWNYNSFNPHTLVVDSDGIGEGVADILQTKRVPCSEFHGGYGAKALDINKYKNLRSQFYWIVAKKFEKGLYDLSQIPDKEFELLKNQLCCMKVKPPDAQGRIQIETKEDLMARGIRSPDYADAFMMSEYGWWISKYADIKAYAYR